MRGEAMGRICAHALESGEPLGTFRALEFFARQGDWQTRAYAHLVAEMDAWELDPQHEAALRANFPRAHVRIGDSFEIAHEPQYRRRFNWLVLDNPQMIYGRYCEHFEALDLAPSLLASMGVVIFNVNKKPFDYALHPDWQARRQAYYGCDAGQLGQSFLMEFYNRRLEQLGMRVRYLYEEPRNAEYLSYIVAGVENPAQA